MTLWIVTVRPPVDMTPRYQDSIWVVKQHAQERAGQLRQELKRSGHKVNFTQAAPNDWDVFLTEACAADGSLEQAGGTHAPQGKEK